MTNDRAVGVRDGKTVFTLFVVPVFYSLIAEEHRPSEPAKKTAEGSRIPRQRW